VDIDSSTTYLPKRPHRFLLAGQPGALRLSATHVASAAATAAAALSSSSRVRQLVGLGQSRQTMGKHFSVLGSVFTAVFW
jgi:hypothetical protein